VETAPRDGTHILGIADGIMTTVYFEDYFSLVVCGAHAEDAEWWPTHWMDLPASMPKGEEWTLRGTRAGKEHAITD